MSTNVIARRRDGRFFRFRRKSIEARLNRALPHTDATRWCGFRHNVKSQGWCQMKIQQGAVQLSLIASILIGAVSLGTLGCGGPVADEEERTGSTVAALERL